jgi:hypothetical protein
MTLLRQSPRQSPTDKNDAPLRRMFRFSIDDLLFFEAEMDKQFGSICMLQEIDDENSFVCQHPRTLPSHSSFRRPSKR